MQWIPEEIAIFSEKELPCRPPLQNGCSINISIFCFDPILIRYDRFFFVALDFFFLQRSPNPKKHTKKHRLGNLGDEKKKLIQKTPKTQSFGAVGMYLTKSFMGVDGKGR